MSANYGDLCSAILEQCFGTNCKTVADCLFPATTRTISQIVKFTNLSRKEVILSLSVLIKYQLVSFQPCATNQFIAEYSIERDNILYLLRYSRYIHLLQTKYGNVGAAIAEELINAGSDSATNVLLKCLANSENKETPETLRTTFIQMISDNYLIKTPQLAPTTGGEDNGSAIADSVPKFRLDAYDYYQTPDIDLLLLSKIREGKAVIKDAKDADILWRINYARFHQDFRDSIMIDAIERKLGENAAECFRFILKQMYERTDPWQRQSSNPFTMLEVKQALEKKSKNLDLMKHLDQYISLIADDSLGFIRKVSDMGCGQYVVDFERAFKELSLACVECVTTERFGSKATRIFRVVRFRKYIEQEDLQKEAMIPAKEAKSLAYNLFQEQFLHVKTIKKAGGGGSGPAKSFYLFYIKEKQTIRMLLDICYKSLCNTIRRSNYEKQENKGLIEKSQRLDSIVAAMRERGESEEYIAEIVETLTPPECEILSKVKNRITTLSKAELTLDDTIFLLQMFQHHCTTVPTSIK